MLYLEQKYVSFLKPKFSNFKKKDKLLWNMRCIYCGDSKRDSNKARAYIYEKQNKLYYYCHNCTKGRSLPGLLKDVDESLYQEYLLEKMGPKKQTAEEKFLEKFGESGNSPQVKDLPNATPIIRLSNNHVAKKYLDARNTPREFYKDIYYVDWFKKWVNENIQKKFTNVDYDEPRIIIPFRKKNRELIGLQGRSLEENAKLRYITVKIDEDFPKLVWGLDRVNLNKCVYVLEGAMDAMFLPNAIASCDSSLLKTAQSINNLTNRVLIFDNQPRNPELVQLVKQAIDNNEKISIIDLPGGKDINDLVLAGWSSKQIQENIKNNTVQGLQATLQFQKWKKI